MGGRAESHELRISCAWVRVIREVAFPPSKKHRHWRAGRSRRAIASARKEIAHEEAQVRRALRQSPHVPGKPLRAVADQHPHAVARLRQPHLLSPLDAVEKLKLHRGLEIP